MSASQEAVTEDISGYSFESSRAVESDRLNTERANEYPLPFHLGDIGDDSVDIRERRSPVQISEIAEFLKQNSQRYDFVVDEGRVLIGDGMNVYSLHSDTNIEGVFGAGSQQDAYVDVEAECLGVLNSDTYDDLLSDGGVPAVEDFLESPFAFYSSEDGIQPSPRNDAVEQKQDQPDEDFYDSNAAEKTVERAMDGRMP